MRRLGLIIALAAMTALGGCAARLARKGDAALAADKPHEALQYYRRAMEKDDDLLDDRQFTASLTRAKGLVAYYDGIQLARRKQWDQAIESLQRAITISPELYMARSELTRTKRNGAKDLHAEAVRAADEGKLNEAVMLLKHALELDGENIDAQEALESLSQKKTSQLNRAGKLYAEAAALQNQRRWARASEALESAIAANPNHLPARAALHEGKENLRRAQQYYDRGSLLLDDKRLDEAIAAFSEATAVWPAYEQAGSQLNLARKLRAQAQELFSRAEALAGRGRWDDAFTSAGQSLEIFPHHEEAAALRQRARNEAAESHLRAGADLLSAGRLDEAQMRFQTALEYLPHMTAAREALASVHSARGDADASAGRWGSAMMWYIEAADLSNDGRYDSAAAGARAAVIDRISFSLAIEVSPRPAGSRVLAAEIRPALLDELFDRAPEFVRLVDARSGGATYTAAVESGNMSIRQYMVSAKAQTHPYTVSVEVVNPRIDRLAAELREARRKLHRLQTRRAVLCTVCRGKGVVICPTCRGKRRIHIKTSVRKVERRRPADKKAVRRNRQGDRKKKAAPVAVKAKVHQSIGCRACATKGKITCHKCRGTGRRWLISEVQLRNQRKLFENLRRRLRAQPQTILQTATRYWRYTLEQHEKIGQAGLHIALIDNRGGEPARPLTVSSVQRRTDSAIDGANPRIGLQPDPLELPSNASIRRAVVRQLTARASGRIITAAIEARLAEALRTAERLAATGDESAALEARIDAALLAEAMPVTKSQHTLAALRHAHKR